MGKLILNHLIGNKCPKFRSRLLGSFYFKLTIKVIVWNFVSGQLLSKPS